MSKKLLSILALLCLTVTSAWADDSGTCGTSLTWSYVESTHTLTISGTGAMADYSDGETPWYAYIDYITNIVIKDGVTTICDDAFFGCNGLTTLTIPNSVTTIGNCAFEWCSSLEEVTIGNGVTSIGDRAFRGCDNLTKITVSVENLYYKSVDNVLFTKDGKRLIQYPVGSDATSYTIPNEVKTIDMFAFEYSCNLTGVTFGSGVTTIGEEAFYNCNGLTTISIPDNVTTIGEDAFGACEYLTTLNIGSGVESICDAPCQGCYNLTDITVSGENLYYKSVDNVLFTYDGKRIIQYPAGSTATSYTIPDGVETIGAFAFDSSFNLTSVTIPNTVTTIGDFAFSGCTGLTTMSIPSSVTYIGDYAFSGCTGLTTMSIPSSVTYIGDEAFGYCSGLTTVTLNSYPYIGWYAFDKDDYGAIPAVTMNLTANAAGGAYWMTFYNDNYSFEADPNTQVFKAELSGTTITLHEVTDKIVNKWEGVILKSSGNPVMTLTTSASGDSQANSLEGVSDPEGQDNDGYFYVLNNGSKGVGFYKLADGKKLGYGKAYLSYDSSSAPSFLGFGDDATSIKSLTPDPSPNGEGSEYYDLQGRRVAQPAKGLYIVNGKKVVIK
jgi:hypothetical protein